MKAEKRIRAYGVVKYIRSCLHKEPTKELIEKYKKKYGEDIPIGQRYIFRTYDAVFEDAKTGDKEQLHNINTSLQKDTSKERDMYEVIAEGRRRLGGSNWFLVPNTLKKVGEEKIFLKSTKDFGKKATTKQQNLKEAEKAALKKQPEKEPVKQSKREFTGGEEGTFREQLKETLQERRNSVAKALKEAGYSLEEVTKAVSRVVVYGAELLP